MTKKIHHSSKDSKGHYIDNSLVGGLYMHTGNNKLYIIDRFVWCADDDTWHVEYRQYKIHKLVPCVDYVIEDGKLESGDVAYTRSLDNFFGAQEGKPRFIKVEK